jgi:hypothetical protein
MKYLYIVMIVTLLGCSQEESGSLDGKDQYGCLGGELVTQTLVDKRVPFNVKGVDQYEEVLAFSADCRDPESSVDPFTNAYRKKEGINLIVCMPGWNACRPGEDNEKKIYITLFLDASKISLMADIRVGRSGKKLREENGVEVYTYKNKYDRGGKYYYLVDMKDDFVVHCSDPNQKKGSCSFRGYDNKSKISYYFIYRPPVFRDWHALHAEVTSFIDKSISLANNNENG